MLRFCFLLAHAETLFLALLIRLNSSNFQFSSLNSSHTFSSEFSRNKCSILRFALLFFNLLVFLMLSQEVLDYLNNFWSFSVLCFLLSACLLSSLSWIVIYAESLLSLTVWIPEDLIAKGVRGEWGVWGCRTYFCCKLIVLNSF